jgi:molybdate transport system substrate-binding protein
VRIAHVAPALLAAALSGAAVEGAEIRVAVAANFAEPLRVLAARFEQRSTDTVTPIVASTGALYAQIVNGAPFDVFLAADVDRPHALEESGLIVAGSRRTYAVGRLVLWSADPDLVDAKGGVLASEGYRRLALANPALAPYGQAAEEVLRGLGLWSRVEPRIVRGESIAQVFSFVSTGNAELGFVAASQVCHPERPVGGSMWQVPQSLHAPIEQQAVLLTDSAAVRAFFTFLTSPEAESVMRRFGYAVPGG